MSRTYLPPEPCAWCGWLRGEHASKCALNAYVLEMAANLEFPPGPNETQLKHEPQPEPGEPAWTESAVKLDCPE